MSDMNQAPAPAPQPAPQPAHAPASHQNTDRKMSGLAVTGLVLGIIGVCLSFIPVINNVAFALGVVGTVFGIIGIVQTGKKKAHKGRGMAIVAVVLSVLAIVFTLVAQQSASDTIDKISKGYSSSTYLDGNKAPKKVELQATATSKGTANYSVGNGSDSSEDFTRTWSKTFTGDNAKKQLSVMVQGDYSDESNSQKVTCTILVDGKQKVHKEANGTSGMASCDTEGLFD